MTAPTARVVERLFPIMDAKDLLLPWRVIEPHEQQAERNHGQTLARLAERGGLSVVEAVAVLLDLPLRVLLDSGKHPKERAVLARIIADADALHAERERAAALADLLHEARGYIEGRFEEGGIDWCKRAAALAEKVKTE